VTTAAVGGSAVNGKDQTKEERRQERLRRQKRQHLQLVEKYRPRSIDDFIGLAKPKALMRLLAANPYSSSWLFIGPSGTGKTCMGLAVADAIPAELHHIPSQDCNLENIEDVCRVCHYVPMSGKAFHLVLVDEADKMTSPAQIALLSKLDTATSFPPATIFIFTCNDASNLEPRFRSRCRQIDFSSYGTAPEITAFLAMIWNLESSANGLRFASNSHPNFGRIVKDSSNNIRESLMRLEIEMMLATSEDSACSMRQ
jgi:replication-associated recombination protein RarA